MVKRIYCSICQVYLAIKELSENFGEKSKKLQEWKQKVRSAWHGVEIINVSSDIEHKMQMNRPIFVEAVVKLGELAPEDVAVQVYFGELNHKNEFINPSTKRLIAKKRGRFILFCTKLFVMKVEYKALQLEYCLQILYWLQAQKCDCVNGLVFKNNFFSL